MTFRAVVSRSLLLLALVGCGDSGTSVADGGMGADGALDGAPAAPAAPMLPEFGPCPEGWRAAPTGEGFDVCEPFPEGTEISCPRDEALFPGTAACAPIGTPCPAGDFPTGLPADGDVLYVLAGATGGDGSESSPFGNIAAATAAAGPGATIALGKGTYEEIVTIPTGVTLLGACVAETKVTTPVESFTEGAINAGGADVTIRNLRVGDTARPGILIAGDGVSATIEDVVLHGCALGGIGVEQGATMTGARIVTRDHLPLPAFNGLGRGLNIESGASVSVRQLYSEGNREFAVVVLMGAELTLEDATIVDTSLATTAALTGTGLSVLSGGALDARRVLIDEATTIAASAQGAGTTLSLEDVVVRRTRPPNGVGGARGIDTVDGAATTCSRCLVEQVRESAFATGTDASLALRDVFVRDVRGREGDGAVGRGLALQLGAQVDVERIAIVDVEEVGIAMLGPGVTLRGGDVLMRRVSGEPATGLYGRGLSLEMGAIADLERLEMTETRETALFVIDGASATLSDVSIRDVRSRAVDGRVGRGITVEGVGTLSVTRALVEGTQEAGVLAFGDGVEVTARDLVIRRVIAQDCGEGGVCVAEPGGHGLGSYFGAQVDVGRFDFSEAALCGVQVAVDAQLRLSDGMIRTSLVGACLQSDVQDIEDLQHEVRYLDNERNLEATMLPVPMPLEAE